MYIEAPPEMVEAMYQNRGYRKDIDKELAQMTEEGKQIILIYTNYFREGSIQLFRGLRRRI